MSQTQFLKMEQGSAEWLALVKRFMDKVQKTEFCWIWKAQIYPTGYGSFYLKRKNIHRKNYYKNSSFLKTFLMFHSY